MEQIHGSQLSPVLFLEGPLMGKVRLVEKTRKIMQWYNSEGDNYIKYRIEPFFISNDDTYVHRIGRLLTHTGPMTPAEIVDARRALRLSGLSE